MLGSCKDTFGRKPQHLSERKGSSRMEGEYETADLLGRAQKAYLGLLVGNIRDIFFWKGLWKLIAIAHYIGLHTYEQ